MRIRSLALSLPVVVLAAACGGQSPEPMVPAASASASAPAPVATTPVTPQVAPPRVDASALHRDVLFGNPDRSNVRLSPDGQKLAWLAPDKGVMNVWVAPVTDLAAAKVVTHETTRPIRGFSWTYATDRLAYRQDTGGDENWHVYAVNVASGEVKDLTPYEKVAAQIQHVSPKFPNEILIGINDRDAKYHDVYRVDLKTGARKLVQQNDGFAAFETDDDFHVRFGSRPQPDGSVEIVEPAPKNTWKKYAAVPMEDVISTNFVGFDKTGTKAYMVDTRGRDTAGLFEVDLATKKSKLLAEDARADVGDFLVHPKDKRIQAVAADYDRLAWKVLDPAVQPDFDYLKTVAEGELHVTSRSLDDKRWTVAYAFSDGPTKFYLYDRAAKKATYLFSHMAALESLKLAKMLPEVIPARDGLPLVSYLTLPPGTDAAGAGKPDHALPLVLFVHGGPWARDEWGYNPYHQWLANRGYAVLSVNYRGSTGFGKNFINAGDREWAGKMHNDLLDAVEWAVREQIAIPDKVAIYGGSYGGYAALVGLTFTPDRFTCGVDIVGPSNLNTLIASIPPYWKAFYEDMTRRIGGDPHTDDGSKFLQSRSPLTYVDRISRPLLIAQGANDPRVKQAESDQVVAAMNKKQLPVTYVLYPDEGHGFARPQNRLSFYAISEGFLAKCLGGRYEPIGTDFDGSSLQVQEGAGVVPGLPEALAKLAAAPGARNP